MLKILLPLFIIILSITIIINCYDLQVDKYSLTIEKITNEINEAIQKKDFEKAVNLQKKTL